MIIITSNLDDNMEEIKNKTFDEKNSKGLSDNLLESKDITPAIKEKEEKDDDELSNEATNELPKEEEKQSHEESQEIQKEVKDNISSIESGLKLISTNENETKEEEIDTSKDNINIKTFKDVNDFFFPIVNNKKPEESKNSAPDIQPPANFSSINLEVPGEVKPKNNTQATQKPSSNMNQMFPPNVNQYYIPNFFIIPNPLSQNFFGNKFFENYNLSYFIPITFSCSLDNNRGKKFKTKSVQEEKEFFEKIIKIADVENISEFWEVFQHLRKPNQCPIGTDYHVFKKGIIPMWEDERNKNGGKLSVLLTWKFANVIWEEITFNFAKGLLPHFEYINGIVISMRPKFLVLSFWIKTNTSTVVEKIRNSLSGMMQAPSANCIDFIPFN